MNSLRLIGARTHNLRGVSLTLDPGQVVAITGVSGAGKSSLALDTLYAEGQRRFVESFSPYARQFLERLERPPTDSLDPIPAAVAVDRAAPVKSSRSTLSTMADLEPLLGALFLREAVAVCPDHRVPGVERTESAAAEQLVREHRGRRAVLSYVQPLKGREHYLAVREELAREGYRRLWVRGEARSIDELAPSELDDAAELEVVLDRAKLESSEVPRMAEAFGKAWAKSREPARVHLEGAELPLAWAAGLSCPVCAKGLLPAVPGLFSHDSPRGACATCRGFGRVIGLDLEKVIPDESKTLAQHAIRPWNGKSTTWERRELKKMCARHGIPMDVPWKDLLAGHREHVLAGDGSWEDNLFPGVRGWFKWLETRTYKMHVRVLLSRYRAYDPCPSCGGSRFGAQALAYQLAGLDIAAWHTREVSEVLELLRSVMLRTAQGRLVATELESRLGYLERVGLGYLNLDRQARTLSGGEAQRVTLTAALGTSLHNALFVLDEPSVGLHPADTARLGEVIGELATRNNIVLVVEHDPQLIAIADRVVELGPGAGEHGGTIVADGTVAEVRAQGGATARAFDGERLGRTEPRAPRGWIELQDVAANNLKHVTVKLPLGVLSVLAGPSGSGKSTLAVEVLYRSLARQFGVLDVERPVAFGGIHGAEQLKQVVLVDQSPLGRTSRGNAATYTKAWDHIRKLFSDEPAAKHSDFGPSHFSFNVDAGRCPACTGEGYETVEMQFLADVRLLCPVCRGQRFKPEVLAIQCRGMNVARVLDLTVDEGLAHFSDATPLLRALGPLRQLGLGYLKLGQSLSTLSGGEAQRLKLARVLSQPLKGTLFIVDEPSAGLHVDEVEKILRAFEIIVEGGGSVLAVEHDLNIIARADWVVEMGDAGGARGGRVVFEGRPNELAQAPTLTGNALRTPIQARSVHAPAADRRAVLSVTNAREHNLKSVSVEVPHAALTVVTGPSGSGKSSLVFDVIFAEGQRRFLETLTPYARQFLPTLPKPDVDRVSGVPPAIALEQRTSRAGANSTVSTVTELGHYLRLLFAKLGVPHCPEHGTPIGATSSATLHQQLQRKRGKFALLAPVVEARKGSYLDVFNAADRAGFAQALSDGEWVSTQAPPKLARSKEHTIDLLIRASGPLAELTFDQLNQALAWGKGAVRLMNSKGELERFSTDSACPVCGFSVPELDPRWFSFNTQQGRCPTCEGAGVVTRTVGRGKAAVAEEVPCEACQGSRLAPIPRGVRLSGESYAEFNAKTVASFRDALKRLKWTGDAQTIAEPIVSELARRAEFLLEVGLGYLTLERAANTLSGGELQRLRLAAQLGAGLTGALYVLDEPTIGLHPRDTQRLIANLKRLVALGSSVVVVEHDAELIRAADYLIDVGPTGGRSGGYVMASGDPAKVLAHPDSPTGRCFSRRFVPRAPRPTPAKAPFLELLGVTQHNLKQVDLKLPVGRLNVVVGVSGSGKSTLIRNVLLPAVRQRLKLVSPDPGTHRSLGELHGIRRAVSVDQSPIGRTPRSVPATFLGIWDTIRALFAATPDAQVAGFGPTRFSFNSTSGGRCKTCEGQGAITHEMSFLPDAIEVCPVCLGLRFEPETLRVQYRGYSVGQVLQLSAAEACEVFANHPKLAAPLQTLVDLGAGYIQLGQGSHTLSGGEAQRLKLAEELTASARHEPTLYVLDEPTTGLHQADVDKLVRVLDRLVERGDTLVVIEHQPQVIASADYVVELGPEAGAQGGQVVASGTPAQLSRANTATGKILRPLFKEL